MKPICPEQVRKILIRGTNWVGDAVMSIPALKVIRGCFPSAHISLLVRPWVKDVYSQADFVDEILLYHRTGRHSGLRGLMRLSRELRQGSFDLAILLQNAMEAALIAWLARVPARVGYARDGRSVFLTHPCRIDPAVRNMHQVYYYLGLLSTAGISGPLNELPPEQAISISARVGNADLESARAILRTRGILPDEPLVGINPGAYYGGAKRWLSERYAAVADRLADRHGVRILLFGSPQERRIAEEVAACMRTSPVVLAGDTTLGQLMGLLTECRLLITNDSGPMHLAAALDVPQIAIFGSTSERATGPLSAKARVVKEPVPCNPCFLRECPIDFRCMTGISVERVLDLAEDALRGSPAS